MGALDFAGGTVVHITAASSALTAASCATGIVVGLVAITPAAGFVSPLSAITIGALAAAPSHFAILYRSRPRLDDSLDVVAAHGAGVVVGVLLTGVFAQKVWGAPVDGLLFGNAQLLPVQALAVITTIGFSAAGTVALLKLVGLFASVLAAESALPAEGSR